MKEKYFKVGKKHISGQDLFFIIEEGQANSGDFDKAISMIDAAVETGADAIEFQLAKVKDFSTKRDPYYEIYAKNEFSDDQVRELVKYTKSTGLEFIAVPLSHNLVEILSDAGCSAFNINASDLTNPDVIDAVSESNLPFFLSLPLASENEIDWAVNRITKRGCSKFGLLLGQHTMASGVYGVSIEHTNLGYVETLKSKYNVPVGFIDHTPLIWMPSAAISAGADIISKHLAISRDEKGPDWHICLEPDEMKKAVLWARKMRESIKTNYKKLAPGENLDKSKMRRSIVASRDLMKGKKIERKDILFKRPGDGIDPINYEKIIGKKLSKNLKKDEKIKFEYLMEDKI